MVEEDENNEKQTNKNNEKGTQIDKTNQGNDKPISDYDKALALVKRREEVTKVEIEVLNRKEKMLTDSMLGGNAVAVVHQKQIEETPQEYRKRIDREISEGRTEFGN